MDAQSILSQSSSSLPAARDASSSSFMIRDQNSMMAVVGGGMADPARLLSSVSGNSSDTHSLINGGGSMVQSVAGTNILDTFSTVAYADGANPLDADLFGDDFSRMLDDVHRQPQDLPRQTSEQTNFSMVVTSENPGMAAKQANRKRPRRKEILASADERIEYHATTLFSIRGDESKEVYFQLVEQEMMSGHQVRFQD